MSNQLTDVAIVGGGMVGSALALGLAQHGFAVTVIEQSAPPEFDPLAPPDVRISAISAASVSLLKSLGVWEAVREMRSHPYRRLETWEWENAHVVFDASELKLPLLGHMVENHVLQRALWQGLAEHPQVTLKTPATLTSLLHDGEMHQLLFADDTDLAAKLVIGADGATSQVRQMAGIGIHAWQYQQSCMLITVQCEEDPGDSTWQQFTPEGPRAFLPLFDNWASLVWYDAPARIRKLQTLSMAQLQQEIEHVFPARLGHVTPIAAGAFPLTRRHALQYVQPGLALVGDAAHTIHPLAGQGVNLGYRDVDALLDVLTSARSHGEAWHSHHVLKRYQTRRMADNYLMQSGMDLFYAGFSNDLGPVRVLRNIGLMAAERAGGLKRQALKYALGL
ncbi:3-demethoxyubiquinol 3-hydroxylase [Yokenella regensburgei]|jgi:2-octaprenyl-3-methyl-6-methoxy-1,4-benzoquinol hydroxylase|uniref:2-octaprenyl-3-methyl-6-methoxy-1,4-benzoquinol hydroxylase n=1 Tax=Yokenella regensburgei TaxID=158877 RepID=A0AB38FQB8_9ENTR|nr:3-demethoxyubiquinol 3-hydroxylase [Yokenella regensburgei]KAF1370963.1 2-octaprenyl-3-methyl-6-methoxy-1,4-benzoquinol hydroxylase [Yokenella regensburgei]KFD23913.1 2-octaprenyl-3-methyl-6-methoxy-1,4-benzoquinol hydroxylase [Yokenella regensburgei ATCC 49455]QIU87959.1 2-octaprenyl-3-methyl-6-methoxy-1,4-benzoquinol hydroxylase [Yokenella regensburgei]SQA59758.1 2-octaprenyl-3-methyl-6-methoxy-1,4-benzoquinol hydroxylase [Yokenella regensburgei]SQA68009.1 2-octaprenyl-3-methyl-6-methoxy-